MKKYSIGDIVVGTVTGVESYGIFLVFDDKSSGLVHISEISDSYVSRVSDYAEIGGKLRVKVIGYDSNDHYRLSLKEFSDKQSACVTKIEETSNGFNGLSDRLSGWIDNSIEEIEKK